MTRRLRALILILPAALAGCGGSLFQSKTPAPVTYQLSAALSALAPTDGAPAALAMDLAVLKPRMRPGLETDRIAVLYPDRRLDYFADARWSGTLGEVLQDLAVQEFRAYARLRTVSGDSSVFASAYWLEIEVTDFQAEYSSAGAMPRVRVQLHARLGRSGDRRILGQFTAQAEQTAAENRLSPIVDAYAHAADDAMRQLVSQSAGILAGASEAR